MKSIDQNEPKLDATPPLPAPLPEVTFTEEEVKKVTDFVNLVYTKASFADQSCKEAQALTNMLNDMHRHVKKIDEYIFEFRKVTKGK